MHEADELCLVGNMEFGGKLVVEDRIVILIVCGLQPLGIERHALGHCSRLKLKDLGIRCVGIPSSEDISLSCGLLGWLDAGVPFYPPWCNCRATIALVGNRDCRLVIGFHAGIVTLSPLPKVKFKGVGLVPVDHIGVKDIHKLAALQILGRAAEVVIVCRLICAPFIHIRIKIAIFSNYKRILRHGDAFKWSRDTISMQCSRKQEVSYRIRTANTSLSCNCTCVVSIYLGVRRAVQYIGVTLQTYIANDCRCRSQPQTIVRVTHHA